MLVDSLKIWPAKQSIILETLDGHLKKKKKKNQSQTKEQMHS